MGAVLPIEVLAALALASAACLSAKLNHDAAWCLAAAQRLVAGERMYVDILEVNPPLVFWLLTGPAWLGRALGIPAAPTAYALHVVLLIGATLVAARVLALAPAPERWIRSGVLCAFLFLATAPAIGDLGQRDLMAAILLLPYVLLAGRTAAGLPAPRSVAILCGLLAAVGVALKPYFVLPWLAVELVILFRRGSLRALWRVDSVLVALGQGVYAALVLALAPEYLSRIVPLAAATYGALGVSRLQLLTMWTALGLWLCGLGALAARRMLPGPLPLPATETLLAAALGFWASYVLQGKGFGYHLRPVAVYAPLGLFVVTLGALRLFVQSRGGEPGQRRRAVRVVFVSAVSASVFGLFLAKELHGAYRWLHEGYPPEVLVLVEAAKAAGEGAPIYELSTSEWPAFPAVNLSGARWPYHFNHLWPLPAFYRGASDGAYHAPDAQGEIERTLFETVVADLVATPPRILIVDREPYAMPDHFDLVTYFSASPAFRELLRGYRSAGRVGAFELFEPR